MLAWEASPYGLGLVLSHEDQRGQETLVAYRSSMMTPTERNYSNTDREALVVVSGGKRFPSTCIGHEPLLGLLHHSRPIPLVLSLRLLQ